MTAQPTFNQQFEMIFGKNKIPKKVINPKDRIVEFTDGSTKKLSDEELAKFGSVFLKGSLYSLGDLPYRLQSILQNIDIIVKEDTAFKTSQFSKFDSYDNRTFDMLLKRRMSLGDLDLPQRALAMKEKIEEENRAQEARKTKAKVESEKQAIERNKFSNKFITLSPYLSIKRYREELEEALSKATREEIEEAKSRLLKGEKPDLTVQQRSFALTWLNSHQNTEKEADESPKSLARKLFELTRGH